MSKPKQGRGGKSPAGSGPGVTRLDRVRALKALSGLTAPWIDWFAAAGHGSETEARGALGLVRVVFDAFDAVPGKVSATAFTRRDIEAALGTAAERAGLDMPPYIEAFALYLEFLGTNKLWTGNPKEYKSVVDALDDMLTLLHQDVLFVIPELPVEVELAAYEALDMFGHLPALLDWIGTGKRVTATGALRRSDIEGAAASVGIAARGAARSAVEHPMLIMARSIDEVPVLSEAWRLLRSAKLVQVTSSTVHPSPEGILLLRGHQDEKLGAYRRAITGFLRPWLEERLGIRELREPATHILLTVFLKAAMGQPLKVEQLSGLFAAFPEVANGPGGADLQDLLGSVTRSTLAELALFGLLEIDTNYRIPPAFIRAYAGAFAAEIDVEIQFPAGEAVPAATSTPAAREYRLKISLVGSRPPIWRRILVPSDISLENLHLVIQRAFGWNESHPHDYCTGGRYGRIIGKDPYDDDPYSDSYDLDEADVPLERFLAIVGDRLAYIYDAGDDWEHLIVLEDIAETGQGRPQPYCIGGRGANALDDCGGVWGWAELVEIVNDTLHPDHTQMRRWAGLRPGEVLDPKEFNVGNVNAALQSLHV